jgi:hypothetical protein
VQLLGQMLSGFKDGIGEGNGDFHAGMVSPRYDHGKAVARPTLTWSSGARRRTPANLAEWYRVPWDVWLGAPRYGEQRPLNMRLKVAQEPGHLKLGNH